MFSGLRHKKSFLLIRNLIAVEVIAYGLFMLVALSADWAEAYSRFGVSDYLSFTVLEFTSLAMVQIAIVVFVVTRSFREDRDIKEIIRSGEDERLEFKTSLRWDVRRNEISKELERSAMKTVAAFLNSDGGNLVIGVDDEQRAVGLAADINSLNKKSHDGFENHFNNLFISMLGPEFRQYVRLSFHTLDDKSVSLVQVDRAHRPAYLKTEKGEDFFIRTGNATTALKVSQVASYISAQWQ
ncbi:MAG: hypothetical protein A3I39_02725 [Candidatus Yanofskybacteria bacterium RIFCSPLOWO2_02_FULL_47_9b]|uniref:Schlafen AlbA-2 domain-containing protein n=1 Tax=Candidatus Yanofskybacteria bacterium RIFCSPLOWO2_02_FULL_47_9b TaxID=1802708 RepID=A0A1F8H761_9BACT|nr:MAG: hypothetical protein A3I39_02725 [Candidatus Yanofskybacteria bacterium RIFCSPLOWO2_02_FULL_47_9b]